MKNEVRLFYKCYEKRLSEGDSLFVYCLKIVFRIVSVAPWCDRV